MITIDPVKKAELDAKKADREARKVQRADLKSDEILLQLKALSPGQLNAFVNSTFAGMTQAQKKVMKMLVQAAVGSRDED
jgi:hypothetical protein